MKKRPLAECSDRQRDLLHVVAQSPGANGEALRRRLEDARDERVPDATFRRDVTELVSKGVVKKNGPEWERAHELTTEGQSLLELDLDWQR